ncbi:type IV pili methyl-accepting chemotaxis transducer N-terminal domain-containing protein [Basilea psittacipulmonis]|uniref:Sensor protein n=1 Tax=Basilea psittacipulmonis DSM 24701 TaxID=1072685 RepID=A0A077DH83_9BURK|nr:type IV pili methyl-accepting chemotaxis transducer N-terminal domain-containing protein [Basilea psittacipulmonis]AIL32827.1 hypothetical protein IX83_05415 [Basilea psittacipulmonis DSM 24701]
MFLKSLSSRLKISTFIWITAALISISLTLLFSWKLEGGAAAINTAGSLRMQTYRLVNLIQRHEPVDLVEEKIAFFDKTLKTIEQGDPSRPLFLPSVEEVVNNMDLIQAQWKTQIRPVLLNALHHSDAFIDHQVIESFIDRINQLVLSIEIVDDRYTAWLRVFQTGLMLMVIIGAGIMIILLYSWIISPLENLQNGVKEILKGNFGTQVPVATTSEFAQVDKGFNQMSQHLLMLYSNLEKEVAQKTSDLAKKNDMLETLYQFSSFFNVSHFIGETCEGFLQRLQAIFPFINASSIRLIDTKTQRSDLIAQNNLPLAIQESFNCDHFNACLCGESYITNDWAPIHLNRNVPHHKNLECYKEHFKSLRNFPIRFKNQEIGYLTLFFHDDPNLQNQDLELLNNLCNQLGIVLSNNQLIEESKQLAVLQERNLIAQGLHDSIAQTLNFLNLQTQMLDDALKQQNQDMVLENLHFIQTGIKECYDDVRELLLNFRTKITNKEFNKAVEDLVARFEKQTKIAIDLHWNGSGPTLIADQQLQFLFILQESLSNIRKHSQASSVSVSFSNDHDYIMTIRDNGCGFNTDEMNLLSAEHIGLRIMKERAKRINATFNIESIIDQGTTIILTLPHKERTYS